MSARPPVPLSTLALLLCVCGSLLVQGVWAKCHFICPDKMPPAVSTFCLTPSDPNANDVLRCTYNRVEDLCDIPRENELICSYSMIDGTFMQRELGGFANRASGECMRQLECNPVDDD